jgi:hypothetical protein
MTEPSPIDLDKRLALLEQLVTSGFRSIEKAVADLAGSNVERIEALRCDVQEIKASTTDNGKRLDRIEPTVRWIEKAADVVWKLAVVAAFAGLVWAMAQAGALP